MRTVSFWDICCRLVAKEVIQLKSLSTVAKRKMRTEDVQREKANREKRRLEIGPRSSILPEGQVPE